MVKKLLVVTKGMPSHLSDFSKKRYFYLEIFFNLDHYDHIFIDICQ